MNKKQFYAGMKASVPVGVGYFAVSFGFGAMAISKGLSYIESTVMSVSNVTSAGQFAAVSVIAAASPLFMMFLTQLVINSRYALMSLALTQIMDQNFTTGRRLIMAFYNTDEVFALAMQQGRNLTTSFMYGLGILPIVGWTSGTLFGGLAGSLLPASVQTALSVALYGMFIAIVLPKAKESRAEATAAALGCLFGSLFTWVPGLKEVSSGLAIVIGTVLSAAVAAILFPVADEEDQDQTAESTGLSEVVKGMKSADEASVSDGMKAAGQNDGKAVRE